MNLFFKGSFLDAEYGFAMKIIWAIGLLAAGQCSTITATYAGQFIMEVRYFAFKYINRVVDLLNEYFRALLK